jgi:hypothetical protein
VGQIRSNEFLFLRFEIEVMIIVGLDSINLLSSIVKL